jgi:hypothetical protein
MVVRVVVRFGPSTVLVMMTARGVERIQLSAAVTH